MLKPQYRSETKVYCINSVNVCFGDDGDGFAVEVQYNAFILFILILFLLKCRYKSLSWKKKEEMCSPKCK